MKKAGDNIPLMLIIAVASFTMHFGIFYLLKNDTSYLKTIITVAFFTILLILCIRHMNYFEGTLLVAVFVGLAYILTWAYILPVAWSSLLLAGEIINFIEKKQTKEEYNQKAD